MGTSYIFITFYRMQFRFGTTWGDVIGSSDTAYTMEEKLLNADEQITGVQANAGSILDGITIHLSTGEYSFQ